MRSDTHPVKLTRARPRTATIVGMERGPFVTLASAGVNPPRRRTSVSPRALGWAVSLQVRLGTESLGDIAPWATYIA